MTNKAMNHERVYKKIKGHKIGLSLAEMRRLYFTLVSNNDSELLALVLDLKEILLKFDPDIVEISRQEHLAWEIQKKEWPDVNQALLPISQNIQLRENMLRAMQNDLMVDTNDYCQKRNQMVKANVEQAFKDAGIIFFKPVQSASGFMSSSLGLTEKHPEVSQKLRIASNI